MRKILFSIAILIFSFFTFFQISSNDALAIPLPPTGLGTSVSCGSDNKTPTITFRWSVITTVDYQYFFQRTGMSEPRLVAGNRTVENVSQDPPGTSYQWSVYVCDREIGFPHVDHGCSEPSPGISVTRPDNCDGSEPEPEPKPEYNCNNRPTKCSSTTQYPLCNGPYTQGEGSFTCPSLNGCPFDKNGDGTSNTTYCAYYEVLSCGGKGAKCDDSTSRNGKSTCCTGLICDPRASSNGTCTEPTGTGPGQNLCIDCADGYTWDEKINKCKNSSGIKNNGQEIACTENQECEMGTGCIDKPKYDECTKKTQTKDCLSGKCGEDGQCVNEGLISFACKQGSNGNYSCKTAIGRIDTSPEKLVQSVLRILLGLSGGILLVLIIFNGYKIMVSQGDPEKIKDAREGIIAAIAGILLIIFSLSILQLITVDIIGIPGFR